MAFDLFFDDSLACIVRVRRDLRRRDYRGRTEGNETEIVEGDLAEIGDCDAVLAAFTAPDEGTAMEAWYAHTLGKRHALHDAQ